MGIKMQQTQQQVSIYLQKCINVLRECILTALIKLGEESVVKVRDRSAEASWIDHTGNLRSSVGYAVYDHAQKVMQSTFRQVLGGTLGQAEGRKMIEELAQQYSKTYAMVVVAGMNYADRVEALNNKDVLESTRIWAEAQVEGRLKTAVDVAMARISKFSI